ncbi:MbcA/ParS/Xre antitoxin family protein [Novosphingobium sp. 1949]|uniref:MbcA/ParS/Xre antitoxin family protein n=1 Tax=Novosphingobium organovorum TaxID=2930092 RepID=A0ABT0BAY9_9SPHN|nr:MbcA/ParS/Xre antitoxin family protein [Novosphingobium organovorum]MCJ2182013.1 MbcA/ParS/Xre antitoxin family protein [Novosphingobium organovorum]
MLERIAPTPASPQTAQVTRAEAGAGVRAVVRLFSAWELSEEDACDLLGGISRSTWRRWKAGTVAKVDRDLAARLSLLLGIHKGLRYLFTDPAQGYRWIRKPNQAFAGQSALEVMRGGSVFALERVRRYLDAERGGW